MLTTGDRIKYFRKQRGITQAQLADLTGIHPVSIRKYETNKMQPQAAQIERVAEALRVNVGAISGSHSEQIQLETRGDLMGLLMVWHKSGILSVRGERGEDHLLDPASIHFVVNPVFETYFSFSLPSGKKEKTILSDDLKICLNEHSILEDLIRWESVYNGYQLMQEKYGKQDVPQIQNALEEMKNNLEQIEMELQGSMDPIL